MIEISTDRLDRVFVRWHGGGPFTVLDRDGTATVEHGLAGEAEWSAGPRYDCGDCCWADPHPPEPAPRARPVTTVNLPGEPA